MALEIKKNPQGTFDIMQEQVVRATAQTSTEALKVGLREAKNLRERLIASVSVVGRYWVQFESGMKSPRILEGSVEDQAAYTLPEGHNLEGPYLTEASARAAAKGLCGEDAP